jgi:phage terminase large subunit GpA-like protein
MVVEMICPTCQTNFYPHMNNVLIGKNRKNNSVFAYYQMCPECKEPILGIKESMKGEVYLNPNDVERLVLLIRQKKDE